MACPFREKQRGEGLAGLEATDALRRIDMSEEGARDETGRRDSMPRALRATSSDAPGALSRSTGANPRFVAPRRFCYPVAMTKPPVRRRVLDPFSAAEAAFRGATAKPSDEAPAPKAPSIPGAKELVSLRLDKDVLDHFQEDGPGWQDRINVALRKAAGI